MRPWLLLLTVLPLPVGVWRVDGVARRRMRLARPAAESGRGERLWLSGLCTAARAGHAVALRCGSSFAIYDGLPTALRVVWLALTKAFLVC